MIFLDLPTELLCRILSYLPVLDLCAAQRTCRQINRIITDTVYFQYVLRAYINGVDDLLPPDCPFRERLELLRHYEKPWNNLQLNISTGFPINIKAPSAYYGQDSSYYTLQDGYLIYKVFKERQLGIPCKYGYLDLLSDIGNKEASWVHILMQNPEMVHLDLIFAADHDLAVSFSTRRTVDECVPPQHVLAFFEFTTGDPHPLSSRHTIGLPPVLTAYNLSIEIEVLGDYLLVSADHRPIYLYLVSWKTGIWTWLRALRDNSISGTARRPIVIDPDNNLVTLVHGNTNCLEICKLEIASQQPYLQTLCFLGLPPLYSGVICVISAADKEWVPTSQHRKGTQSSRRRLVPFRSSKISSFFLSLQYRNHTPLHRDHTSLHDHVHEYGMIVSVAALLSEARFTCGDITTKPWARWGPAATHIFPPKANGTRPPHPAGPFWIIESVPLVIRDYDVRRKWRIQATDENASSISRPTVSSTKIFGLHWMAGEVETWLPYRDVVATGDRQRLQHCTTAIIDREWLIGIWIRHRTDETAHVVVHHIG